MKKALLLIAILFPFLSYAQPANDLCPNAIPIVIPASGTICINGTNLAATSDNVTDACDVAPSGKEVWYTFITTGTENTVTVSPGAAPSAQRAVVTLSSSGCGSGSYDKCAASATNGGTASVLWSYAVGDQVWVRVTTNGGEGNFQLCITSVSPPPAPGETCPTAARLCDKSSFSVANMATVTSSGIKPSCFAGALGGTTSTKADIFYKFTVGKTGTLEWTGTPLGNAEFDWAVYDITGGCLGVEKGCNYTYSSATGKPFGMKIGGTGEFSPPITVTAGNTYILVIDNYSKSAIGFDFSWGGTFEMAPTSIFTATPATGCAPVSVSVTNTSTAATSYVWDWGDGTPTSSAVTPPAHAYATPGTYLISLITTSSVGCTNLSSKSVVVYPKPTAVASPQTICSGQATNIGISSTTTGATFSWTAAASAGITGSAAGSGSTIAQTLTNTGTTTGTVTYTITPTGPAPGSCAGTPITVVATVNPKPVAAASPQTICSGQATNIAITSGVASTTFAWTASASAGITGSSAGSGTSIAQTLTNSGTIAGTVTYTITPTGPAPSSCVGNPITVVATVNPTPVANASPQSICSGQTTNIPITSGVASTTFNWTASASAGITGSSSGSGTPIAQTLTNSGTTSGTVTYTITPTGPAPSNCVGTPVAVVVTVNPIPTVSASNKSICSGTGPNIGLSSTIVGSTFSWTVSSPAAVTGASASSGSTINQTLTNSTAAAATVTYTVTPTGPAPGNCPGSPIAVQVTVNPSPTATASAQTICSGQTTNIGINSTTAGATFSWTASASAGISGSAAGSGSPIAQTLTNSGTAAGTVTYTITPMGPAPTNCAGPAVNVIATVNPTPNAVASPQAICSGQTTSIGISSGVTGTTFSWTASASAGITGSAAGSGSTISQTLTNSGTTPGTVTYTVTPTGPAPTNCPGTPVTVVATVNPTPSAVALSQTICSGETSNIAISSNVPGATFSWTAVAGIGITGAGAGSGSTLAQLLTNTGLLPGIVTYTITPTGPAPTNCPGPPVIVVVTVNPTPNVAAAPQTICSGQATSINLNSGTAGTTFSWTAVASAGVTGSTFGSGSTIAQTLTNTGATVGTVTYTVTPTGPAPNNCVGTPIAVVVTVNPTPSVSALPQTICSGTASNVALSSAVAGTTFSWTASASAGITGSAAGSGSTIAQTLTNSGTVPGTVTYTVTPTGPAPTNCPGSPITVVVTVDPIPNAVANPASICSGQTTGIAISSNVATATFSWTVTGVAGTGGFSAGSGNTISQTLTNSNTSASAVTYTITPTGAAPSNCVGSPINVVVTVNPNPDAIATPSSQTICSTESTAINLSSSVAGSSFSWTASSSATISGAGAGSGSSIAQTLTNSSNTLTGTVTYTITPTGPAPSSCPGSPINVVITVNPTPVMPTVSDVNYCQGAVASPLTAIGSNLTWYPGGATAPTPGTASSSSYQVSQTINGCESPKATINVIVNNPPPAPTAPAPAPYCQGDIIAALTASGSGGTLNWHASAPPSASIGVGSPFNTGLTSSGCFWVDETTAQGCTGPATQVCITVNPKDDAGFSYPSNIYCKTGSDPSPSITTAGGTFSYTSVPAGKNLSINTSTGAIALSGSDVAAYTITYITGGICPDTSETTITISTAPDATFSYTGPYCQGGSPNPLALLAPGATAGVFSSVPVLNASELDVNTGEVDLGLVAPGTYSITNTIAAGGGCALTSHTETIQVDPTPTVTANPVEETICSGESTSISLTGSPAGVTFDWTVLSINGSISGSGSGSGTSISQTLTNSGTTPGTVIYEITPHLVPGNCPGEPITVMITVNPTPPLPVTDPAGPYCQGDVATALNATGAGTMNWYTSASGGTASSAAPVPATGTAGITSYYVSQTIDGCEGPRAEIQVTVNAVPAAPAAAGATYCEGAAVADLTAGPGMGGTFKWYSDAATTNQVGVGSPFSSGATVTTTYYVTETKAGCTGPATAVVITINPKDDASFNYPSATFCLTGADPNPTITGLAGGSFTATGSGVINPVTGTINLMASAPVPPVSFDVTYTTSGTCPNSSTVTVTITSSPSADFSYAGPYCNYGSNPLPLIVPPNSAGTFSGPTGLVINPNTGEINLVASTPGTYTVSNDIAAAGGCAAAGATASVTINPSPVAPTTASVSYCENATALPLTATGSGTLNWYGTAATGGTGSTTAPTPATTPAGTTRYYVSQTVAGCEGPRAWVTVNINPIPAPPVAPSPAPYCAGAVIAPLTAAGSGGTLNWYSVYPGAIAVGGANTSTFNSGATATSTFYVTETASGCTSNPTAVTITVNPLDDASFAYSSNTYCKLGGGVQTPSITRPGGSFTAIPAGLSINLGTGAIDVTLSSVGAYTVTYTTNGPCPQSTNVVINIVTVPSAHFIYDQSNYCQVGTAIPDGQGIGTAGIFTASPTGLSINSSGHINLAASAAGTYTVTNTISAAGCPVVTATTQVTIDPTPGLPGVSDLNYCLGASASPLTATASAGLSLKWYNAQAPFGTQFPSAPTPNTSVVGTTSFYVSQSSGTGCEGARAVLRVTINPVPGEPSVSTPPDYCKGATANPLIASPLSGGTLYWYTSSSGGIGSTTAPTPSTLIGQNFWVSERTASGCEGNRKKITVTVYDTPAPQAINATHCWNAVLGSADTMKTTGVSATGRINWYDASTGGTQYLPTPIPVTTATGTTTYYAEQLNNGCPSPRIPVTVTITAPNALTIAPVGYCFGDNASPLNPSVDAAGNTLLWYDSNNMPIAPNPLPNTGIAGTQTYYVAQRSSATCVGPKSPIIVTINQAPAPATTPISYCQNTPTTIADTVRATGTNISWYSALTGGFKYNPTPIPSTANQGVLYYYASQSIYYASQGIECTSDRTALQVTINSQPVVQPISTTICEGQQATLQINSPNPNYTYNWYELGGMSIVHTGTSWSMTLDRDTIFEIQAVENICESTRATAQVTVNPNPVVSIAADSTCEGTSIALTINSSQTGTYTWYDASMVLIPGQSAISYNPGVLLQGTYTYYAVVTNNSTQCSNAPAMGLLTVDITPGAPRVTGTSACTNKPHPMLTALPAMGTGTRMNWYDASQINLLAQDTINFNNNGDSLKADATYYVSETRGVCTGPKAMVVVVATPLETPSFDVVVPPTACPGDPMPFSLTNMLNTGGNGISYKWEVNNTEVGTTASMTHAISAGGTYWVKATVKIGEGVTCPSDSTATDSMMVTIQSLPAQAINPLDNMKCEPLVVTFEQSADYEYVWNFGNGTSKEVSPTHTFTYLEAPNGGIL